MNPFMLSPLGSAFLIGGPAMLFAMFGVALVTGKSATLGRSVEEQAAEDDEQMHALAEWRQAYVARQNAVLRKDTRATRVAEEALKTAMAGRLKAGL